MKKLESYIMFHFKLKLQGRWEKYQKGPKLPRTCRIGFKNCDAFLAEKLFWKIRLHLLVLKQLVYFSPYVGVI